MPHINCIDKEISFKLVYYGPGMSGKTTNLVHIHKTLPEELRSDMLSLDTTEDRTLFFDFFPVELGRVEGYGLHFNLYTVPGQICYEASRRLILCGVDGVVFVADSAPDRLERNVASFEAMQRNLASHGIDWSKLPIALQYNKRDLGNRIPVGTLERRLGLGGIPVFEAVAITGQGVGETIRAVSRAVIKRFQL